MVNTHEENWDLLKKRKKNNDKQIIEKQNWYPVVICINIFRSSSVGE